MKADPKTEAAVLAVIDRFIKAYIRRDPDACLAVFSPQVVTFGTGADEKIIGLKEHRAQWERDFSQAEPTVWDVIWQSISARDSVAWVAAECRSSWLIGDTHYTMPARWTLVLERRGDQWLIVQNHASVPAREQAPGQSYPTPMEAIASAVREERPDLRPRAAPDGTVTMLFTDIENSTNLTERLGDTQWLDVLRAHNSVVREQVKEHRCFEVKSQGDGFMIASQSARRGVHCAIGIQRDLAKYNQTAPEPINVRMGLHTGEVLKDADDFFGKHVILASRIAGKARGGEILVSSLLRDLTESAGDLRFGEARDVELKGLSGTYRIYEVIWNASHLSS